MGTQRFTELLDTKAVRLRQALLSYTNLASEAPELYSAVADGGGWREFIEAKVQSLGFMVGSSVKVNPTKQDADACGGLRLWVVIEGKRCGFLHSG
jgi:hypothetical protein